MMFTQEMLTIMAAIMVMLSGASATTNQVNLDGVSTQSFAYTAPARVNLNTASQYGIIAGQTITNDGPTVISGKLALYPGSAVVGFGDAEGKVTGDMDVANQAALIASKDLTAAYTDAKNRPSNKLVSGELGSTTYTSGVYTSAADVSVTDVMTLNCEKREDCAFIFQIGSELIINNGAKIQVINKVDNSQQTPVWWAVGSSATIGEGAIVVGQIMTYASVSVEKGSSTGPLLAQTGSVTLLTDTVRASAAYKSLNPAVVVIGTNAGDVAAVVSGGGRIFVENNGAHVAATQEGTGSISVTSNGGPLAATNTGAGTMTIISDSSAAVAITRIGNGDTYVIAHGTTPIALELTGDQAVVYPTPNMARKSALMAVPGISVTGPTAADVTPTLTGGGSIKVYNSGAHVAATQSGTGSISVTNSGGPLAATNTGTGAMTVISDSTAAVAVTRLGNGNTYVTAHGTTPIALEFAGDGHVTYPGNMNVAANPAIQISGTKDGDVAATVTDGGFITVTNNGGFVTATKNGNGKITITNNGAGVTATHTGVGNLNIVNTCTAAVTVTRNGNGNTYVATSGVSPITYSVTGDGDVTFPNQL